MECMVLNEAFLKPLRAISGIFEKKAAQNVPILANVHIQVKENSFWLTAADQEVEVEVQGPLEKWAEPAAVTVPYRKLLGVCSQLPEFSLLSLKASNGKMRLVAGKSRFDLVTLPAEHFPKKQEEEGKESGRQLKISAQVLKELFRRTAFVMGDKHVRHYMSGTLLEVMDKQICVVTIDGHRVAIATSDFSSAKEMGEEIRVIIPKKGVSEVQKVLGGDDEELLLFFGKRQWQVKGSFFTITSRLYGGDFPPYESLLHPLSQGQVIMKVSKDELRKALSRGATLLSEECKGARFCLSEGMLKIVFVNTEHDEAEEMLNVEYQGEPIEICFNVRYLLDFLFVLPTEKVQFTLTDRESSARVEGVGADVHSTVYIIMPMQL